MNPTTQTKENLLTDFYTLKAGLSYIAKQASFLKKYEDTYSDLDGAIVSTKENIANTKLYLDSNDPSKYTEAIEKNEESIRIETLRYKGKHTHIVTLLVVSIIVSLIVALAVDLGVCGGISKFAPGLINQFENAETIIPIIGFFAIFAIELVICILCHLGKKKKLKEEFGLLTNQKSAKFQKMLDDQIEKIKDNVDKEIENKLQSYENHLEILLKCKEAREAVDQFNYNLSLKQQPLFESLKTSYSKELDLRDWENLDLIIYYLETKRADTLKEALQLVDNEIHNQNITNAIADAVSSLSHIIMTSINTLKAELDNSFNELNSKILKLNKSTEECISAIELNNALIEQSDRSTKEIANDVSEVLAIAKN